MPDLTPESAPSEIVWASGLLGCTLGFEARSLHGNLNVQVGKAPYATLSVDMQANSNRIIDTYSVASELLEPPQKVSQLLNAASKLTYIVLRRVVLHNDLFSVMSTYKYAREIGGFRPGTYSGAFLITNSSEVFSDQAIGVLEELMQITDSFLEVENNSGVLNFTETFSEMIRGGKYQTACNPIWVGPAKIKSTHKVENWIGARSSVFAKDALDANTFADVYCSFKSFREVTWVEGTPELRAEMLTRPLGWLDSRSLIQEIDSPAEPTNVTNNKHLPSLSETSTKEDALPKTPRTREPKKEWQNPTEMLSTSLHELMDLGTLRESTDHLILGLDSNMNTVTSPTTNWEEKFKQSESENLKRDSIIQQLQAELSERHKMIVMLQGHRDQSTTSNVTPTQKQRSTSRPTKSLKLRWKLVGALCIVAIGALAIPRVISFFLDDNLQKNTAVSRNLHHKATTRSQAFCLSVVEPWQLQVRTNGITFEEVKKLITSNCRVSDQRDCGENFEASITSDILSDRSLNNTARAPASIRSLSDTINSGEGIDFWTPKGACAVDGFKDTRIGTNESIVSKNYTKNLRFQFTVDEITVPTSFTDGLEQLHWKADSLKLKVIVTYQNPCNQPKENSLCKTKAQDRLTLMKETILKLKAMPQELKEGIKYELNTVETEDESRYVRIEVSR
jgi:hypothetical protein